jgi:SAM-dependent methyltransferase
MDPTFKDYFSSKSDAYAQFRPHYPASLYAYLASISLRHELAWDCATGTGQAALGLAPYFDRIIATDASENQIAHARPHPKISYQVAPAGKTSIPTSSADLIVVAQALHWFDLNEFYSEVERVLKPQGVIAAWSYNLLTVSANVDAVINRLYEKIVGAYWPEERNLVEDGYKGLAFPFEEVNGPTVSMTATWSLEQLTGYLHTWSAVQRYQEQNKRDPVAMIVDELCAVWGEAGGLKRISWPLSLRIGFRYSF